MFKIPNFKQNRGETFILSPSRTARYASQDTIQFLQNKANLFVMSTASLRLRSGQGCVLRREFEKTKPICLKAKLT